MIRPPDDTSRHDAGRSCTGAPRRDFRLGMRHGQLVRAQVPSWCSWHGWTLVAPDELARLARLQLVATRHLEGTGGYRVDAGCSRRAGPPGQLTARRDQTPGGHRMDAPGRHLRAKV